jgi:hypothetical protein
LHRIEIGLHSHSFVVGLEGLELLLVCILGLLPLFEKPSISWALLDKSHDVDAEGIDDLEPLVLIYTRVGVSQRLHHLDRLHDINILRWFALSLILFISFIFRGFTFILRLKEVAFYCLFMGRLGRLNLLLNGRFSSFLRD